jgi:hypothetical protein
VSGILTYAALRDHWKYDRGNFFDFASQPRWNQYCQLRASTKGTQNQKLLKKMGFVARQACAPELRN